MSRTAFPPGLITELRRFRADRPELLNADLAGLDLWLLKWSSCDRFYSWRPTGATAEPGDEIVLKLHTREPLYANRERNTLSYLANHDIAAAPHVLWHDMDEVMPVTAMVPPVGRPINAPNTPCTALHALAASLRQLRAVPSGPFTEVPRAECITGRMEWIIRSWPAALNWGKRSSKDPATAIAILGLLNTWKKSSDIDELTRHAAAVVSPGHPDLNDWLWDSETGSLCLLDWASTGVSDVSYDAADLIEHPTARQFSDNDWMSLLPELDINDDATRRRFLAAQRLSALRLCREAYNHRVLYRPALAEHDAVVVDHGVYAKLAYAVAVLTEQHPDEDPALLLEQVRAVAAPWFLHPDVALWLDMPWPLARERAVARGHGGGNPASVERLLFLPRYNHAYRLVADAHSDRVRRIRVGTRTTPSVLAEIDELLFPVLHTETGALR